LLALWIHRIHRRQNATDSGLQS